MKRILTIVWSYAKTKYFQKFKTRDILEKWQEKQIQQHLSFLKKTSPYFSDLLSKINEPYGLKTLVQLPKMNKTVMMEHFDEINTKKIKKEKAFEIAFQAEETRDFSSMIRDITIGLSSGTSGNRGLFIVSEEERNRWAGTVLAKLLPNGILKKEKIAFFLRANSNLYESVTSKRIVFSFFDLLDSLEKHIENLQLLKPSILVAPPSMIRMLAEKKEQELLDISPKKIISVAEVLEPLDQEYIERVFRQKIHQVYQCTEGFLGFTCEKGTLHLNEDVVYIEKHFLDEEKVKFSPIITDFSRKTQPIIRYHLNDILTIKRGGCSCGSVMTPIEQIEGRCDDIFHFLNKDKEVTTLFPDFIRRWIMTSSDDIEEYRIIQHSHDMLEIQLKIKQEKEKENIQKQIKETIISFLGRRDIIIPTIQFTLYKQNEKGVKLKRVERRG